MGHLSIAYLEAEANAWDLEAARIEAALRMGGAAEAEARACIQRAQERLQGISRIEGDTIGAVLREHVADAGATPLEHEWHALEVAAADRRRIEQDLRTGSDCRRDLQAYARHLHIVAAIGRDEVAPWAQQVLGDVLLREADARLRAYGRTEPEVAVDWNRLAA